MLLDLKDGSRKCVESESSDGSVDSSAGKMGRGEEVSAESLSFWTAAPMTRGLQAKRTRLQSFGRTSATAGYGNSVINVAAVKEERWHAPTLPVALTTFARLVCPFWGP